MTRFPNLHQNPLPDSLPEQWFDDCTALAAHVCGVPVALLSLLDGSGQWTRSCHGLDPAEMPWKDWLSKELLNGKKLLVVPDTTVDGRFADIPHFTCLHGFRFYAGLPLITPDGTVLGTLSIIARAPQHLSPMQERFLELLGRHIVTQVHLAKNRVELIENALLNKQIVDESADAIISRSLAGDITGWNPGAERLFGFSAEDMKGWSVLTIIPPDRRAEEQEIARQIQSGASVDHIETVRKTRSGDLIDVSVSASPIRNIDGRIIGISKVLRNISERKKNEARFHRLMNSNVQGVISWNLNGHIVDANDMFLKMTGHTKEDLKAGHISWQKLTPPEFDALDQRALEQISEQGYCDPFEKEFLRKDGSRVPVLIGGTIFEENPEEGVSFVLDLTERKKLEQQFLRAQRMESIGTLAGGYRPWDAGQAPDHPFLHRFQ